MAKIDIRSKDIKLVPIDKIKPWEKNRNVHPKEQIDEICELIKYQGFRNPLIISNQTGLLIAGHGRLLAAKKMKLKEVPVIYQDFESEDQAYAYMVSDNAIGAWAELDLSNIQLDIKSLSADFDMRMLGIKNFELGNTVEGECDPDEVPDVPLKPNSVLGDLYELGGHRLLCGDSTSIDAVEKLMAGAKADMVFTDPPYGVSYTGGHNKKKRSGIENDTLEGDNLSDLFQKSLSNAEIVSQDHCAFYIWYANGKAVETFKAFDTLSLSVRAVICWYKVKSGLGAFMSQYIPNYEPCIYAFKKGCSPQWFGPTDEKTVWELKKEQKNEYHPTQKPVELSERAITNSSEKENTILDLFGGSGSTLIACEKTKRKCFMMELDPHYVDVIVSRYVKFSGNSNIKLNGKDTDWNAENVKEKVRSGKQSKSKAI